MALVAWSGDLMFGLLKGSVFSGVPVRVGRVPNSSSENWSGPARLSAIMGEVQVG
jgi:hypothetical protein